MKKALSILFAVVLVFAALPVSAATVDESNLQVRYEFDGDAGDATVTGDKLDAEGGNLEFVDGVVGQAAKLDGATGIRLPNGLIQGDQYSVAMWLNPSALTSHTPAFFGIGAGLDSFVSLLPGGFGGGDNTILWSRNGPDGSENWFDGFYGQEIPVDEWSHVAFTVSGSDLVLYLNGSKVASFDNMNDVFTTDDGEFAFGVNYWDPAYQGLVDDLMIFDTAVSGDVIADYYASATSDAPADDAEATEDEAAEDEAAEEEAGEDEAAEEEEEGTTLPATATNQFTFIMIGALLVLISGGFLLAKNRVSNKE